MPGYSNDKGGPPSSRGRAHSRANWARYDEDADAVASYLADMAGQLESMARAANLELLAYLLAMARSEAESLAPKPAAPDDLSP